MKGDVATRKESYAVVVLSVGTTKFEVFLGTRDGRVDGVGSIHGEIKVATPIPYGLEDLPCLPAFSFLTSQGEYDAPCPERPQFENTADDGAYYESTLPNDCESILTKGYESILWWL